LPYLCFPNLGNLDFIEVPSFFNLGDFFDSFGVFEPASLVRLGEEALGLFFFDDPNPLSGDPINFFLGEAPGVLGVFKPPNLVRLGDGVMPFSPEVPSPLSGDPNNFFLAEVSGIRTFGEDVRPSDLIGVPFLGEVLGDFAVPLLGDFLCGDDLGLAEESSRLDRFSKLPFPAFPFPFASFGFDNPKNFFFFPDTGVFLPVAKSVCDTP
jgi:hypothetical protein